MAKWSISRGDRKLKTCDAFTVIDGHTVQTTLDNKALIAAIIEQLGEVSATDFGDEIVIFSKLGRKILNLQYEGT